MFPLLSWVFLKTLETNEQFQITKPKFDSRITYLNDTKHMCGKLLQIYLQPFSRYWALSIIVTTLTFQGHVKSSVTWPFDSQVAKIYNVSICYDVVLCPLSK